MKSSTMQQDFVEDVILMQGMQVQLDKWQCLLESGHKRVGWKIGFNALADQQRMKLAMPIVGFLTSESILDSGSTYKGKKHAKLMLEAEVGILIGKDVSASAGKAQLLAAIEGFAPAIEVVDVARSSHDITSILEDNIFHETFILGELIKDIAEFKVKDILGNVSVNNQVVQTADPSRYPDDISEVVSVVADTLAKQGKCLQAGDWIISGSITQPVEVFAGDQVEVALLPLGSLSLNIDK